LNLKYPTSKVVVAIMAREATIDTAILIFFVAFWLDYFSFHEFII
jgi:hypothetical protein